MCQSLPEGGERVSEPWHCAARARNGAAAQGLGFPGDEEPDGFAFFYFSFAVGSSVATSDTKVTSNTMRRRVGVHSVLSHLYNTIILASAVNVVMALGGGG